MFFLIGTLNVLGKTINLDFLRTCEQTSLINQSASNSEMMVLINFQVHLPLGSTPVDTLQNFIDNASRKSTLKTKNRAKENH